MQYKQIKQRTDWQADQLYSTRADSYSGHHSTYPCTLWNTEVHHHYHKNLTLDPNQSQTNPVRTFTAYC
jgi:hypothetical protein